MRISVIDYGAGNIASLINVYEYLGYDLDVISSPNKVLEAKKLILPGVGAFDSAMTGLSEMNLVNPIKEAVISNQTPILGICLGMQLLGTGSSEGDLVGLSLVPAKSISLKTLGSSLKVPNMGWSEIHPSNKTQLFASEDNFYRFYFAHSYFVQCSNKEDIAATINFGHEICVAIEKNNIFGVQFHPEKSHSSGLKLLQRFAEI